MTPAVEALRAADVDFEILSYHHDPGVTDYGAEVVAALGLDPASVYKTLVTDAGAHPVVAVVPMTGRVDLKALARAVGAKRAELADETTAERLTGYVVGGISPFGQRRPLATVLDEGALDHRLIHVSGGRRGLELALDPHALVDVLDATVAPIATGSARR